MEGASNSAIDYENMPVLAVGQKKSLNIKTYIELHRYIEEITKVLEEVFELGIMKGTAKRFHIVPEDDE